MFGFYDTYDTWKKKRHELYTTNNKKHKCKNSVLCVDCNTCLLGKNCVKAGVNCFLKSVWENEGVLYLELRETRIR